MPTINKRFLLKLLLVLFASTGTLIAAHAVQARRIPAALKLQAERAAEAGKSDLAIHYLRQYLEFNPEDADVLVRLSELLAKRAPTQRGRSELLFLYDKILRLDPDRHPIRRDALAISLLLGRNPDAVTHAEILLKEFPNEAPLWQQLGTAQAGLHDLQAARASYETALTHAPEEMLGYQLLAQLLWKDMNDESGARAVLDRMVKARPQDPDVYLIRARFETYTAEESGVQLANRGDLTRAARDLQRVLELDPENAEASLLLSEIMQRNRNIPAAHALLRDAVSMYPCNQRLVRALSWLELIRGNPAAAITVLEDALRATPKGFDLMVPLADLLMEQGEMKRTADLLRRLDEQKAPSSQLKYLKARVAMREQKWAEAVTMIESLQGETTNLPGLQIQLNLLLATCYQKLGDTVAEEHAYLRAAGADSKNVSAHVGLANLYMNLGRFDDAAGELDRAVQSPYATGVVVTQWVKLKARLLVSKNDPAGLQVVFELLNRKYASRFGRGSSEPAILLAELIAMQGRLEEAVRLLRGEAAVRPGDARLWAACALMTAELNGTAAGLVVIDEAQASAGDCVDVRLARAALYTREPGRIRPIDGLGARIETWPENEQIRLLLGLVEVYDQLGDRASVVHTLKRIMARQPSNAAMWSKLHERAPAGDPTAAQARAALAKLEGENGPSVLLCDARTATAAEAPAVAARVTSTFTATPNRSDACLALARLKRLSGDEPGAAALTERAFLLEPTRYETAEALVEHRARTAAPNLAQVLDQLARDPRWAGEPFRRMVGHVLMALPGPTATTVLAICRPLVEREPGGAGWVADWAVRLNQPEAPALLDATINQPRATPDDWLRKALVVSKENPAAGPEVIRAAKAKLTPSAFADLVAVYADTAAGSTFVPEATTPAEKRALAQARLTVKLSRGLQQDAGKILEGYLAEKDTGPADADWGRRNLAMIYAVGGTPNDRSRAMALVNAVKAIDTATTEDLRATVNVLATLAQYLEGPDRRAVLAKAQAALERVCKTTNAPADLYALAQLYRASGDRAKFRHLLQQLLYRKTDEPIQKDPSYVFYLTAALEELVEEGELKTAETFANELRSARPTDFNSLAALARFECKAGHPDKALGVAEDYARLADSASSDYLLRSAQVAELLDELSRLPNVRGTPAAHSITDAAVERFAALVPNRPEAIVGVAGALAADGRADKAFQRIDQLSRYLPARLRASAGLAIVRSGEVSITQAELVQQWLDACLKEDKDSVTLILNKAEFLARRNDLAGATAAFEQALEKEPKNVVALNNLAWLLAADPRTAERAFDLVNRATREGGLTGELLDTRARIQITLKQFKQAELDLAEAISHDPTPLRWFHVAVLRMSQTPQAPTEAAKAFAEAKRRGIDTRSIHPADLPTYRVLEAK
jgi:tetratricopeptide (TPR) repeat protein